MILTLTLNASWDRFVVCPGFRQGRLARATHASGCASGKGVDVSRTLHRLGDSTLALVVAGGIIGRIIELSLQGEGIPSRVIRTAGETRANHTLIDPGGDELLVVEPGGTVSSEELAVTRRALSEELPRAEFLVLAGSVPPGVEPDTYQGIILEARALGVRTAVDTRGPALARAVEANPWLIKPNREELRELIGRPLRDERELLNAAREVCRSGVEIVIVSLGAAGALIVSDAGAWTATPPQVSVVSTVGCGDALLAGAIHAARGGGTPRDMVWWGVAAGTANTLVASPGGVVVEDVLRLLPEVEAAPM